ncbi:MauE/DoxX family redox-associated membrane protein [Streptomyces sp. CC219B]|uniref:MauE/DoxX family redox-associated membrane protein n=1 Tax=Streptomyces sp. CC219B TaxID=3044574 RepID=UPI0024A98DCB|nr:MauE/DoxX family redox-associated membrane protein [Streptomyces sp. CC219B]
MQAVEAFGRLCLVAVFVWSAGLKLRSLSRFRDSLAGVFTASGRWVPALAIGVPVTELLTAACLLPELSAGLPGWTDWLEWAGFAGAAVLLTAFTGYLTALLRFRPDAGCGCAGAEDIPVSGVHVTRNLFLLSICLATWMVTVADSARPSVVHYVVATPPAVTVGLLLLYMADLFSLLRTPRSI